MNYLQTISAEIDIPTDVINNTFYLSRMGSKVFGANIETSDDDYIGFMKPSDDDLYPYKNKIYGFGPKPTVFEQWQKEHLVYGNHEFDMAIYSIVKIASMAFKGAPNALEVLFCDNKNAIITSEASDLIKSHASEFVSRSSTDRMFGFAKAEYKSVWNKNEQNVDYTKSAYHTVRLLKQCVSLLKHKSMVLDENSVLLTEIRNGVYSFEDLIDMIEQLKFDVQSLEETSDLPYMPDYDKCFDILSRCIMLV